jgi:hypothetical protein
MENFFDASRKSIITSDELNFEKIRNNFSRLIPIHLLLKGSGVRTISARTIFVLEKIFSPERCAQPIKWTIDSRQLGGVKCDF